MRHTTDIINPFGGKTMIRGIHKNMIQMQTPKHPYFETAYFVMRSEISQHAAPSSHDMLNEANRIIAESNLHSPKEKKRIQPLRSRLCLYFCGVLTGSSLVAFIWLAVMLVS